MKKLAMLGFAALLAVFAISSTSNAMVWTTNVADIYAAGGVDVVIPGAEYSLISSLADPFGGMINLSSPAEVRLGNISWNPWRSGSNEKVLWTGLGVPSITLDFDNAPVAWGMWAMPNLLSGPFNVTLGLANGSSLTQLIDGIEGPNFFGFTEGADVDWMTISVDETTFGLGFGEMVMSNQPVIPEPTTMILFGLGLAGVAVRNRFKK
jgi:hypothetical protein